MSKTQYYVQIDEDLFKQAQECAKGNNTTLTELVSAYLRAYANMYGDTEEKMLPKARAQELGKQFIDKRDCRARHRTFGVTLICRQPQNHEGDHKDEFGTTWKNEDAEDITKKVAVSTDDRIEAAAAELYGAIGGAKSRWSDVATSVQDHYREIASLALKAAQEIGAEDNKSEDKPDLTAMAHESLDVLMRVFKGIK